MVARVCLVLAALVGIAWVGASLQGARLEGQANQVLVGSGPTQSGVDLNVFAGIDSARIKRAADLLERSGDWAPLQEPVVLEAQLRLGARDGREAVRLLDDLVRREPENVPAWAALNRILPFVDKDRVPEAQRRLRQLSPPVAEG